MQLEDGDPVAEFGLLSGEQLGVDLVGQPQVDQAVLLIHSERDLPLQLGALSEGFGLGILGLGTQDGPEPLSDVLVVDADLVEDGEHLPVEFGLGDAGPRMTGHVVVRAPVVGVLPRAVLGALRLSFTRDRMTAVPADDLLAGIGHLVGLIDVSAEQCLHAVPRPPVHKGLVLTGVPVTAVRDFADIRPVPEDRVHRAPGEAGL